MAFIVPILLIVAIVVLHIHTCFAEAVHLNKWRPWLVFVLDLLRKYSSHRINQSCNQIYP